MAKKFDLAALMGEAVSKSDTGEMRIEQIPMTEIEENANNSYAQTDIDDLAESIKVIGLQQPLVVRRKTEGGYLLLAGHRRRNALEKLERKTAPCIVLDANLDPALQTLILHWTNTMARGGGGLTAEYYVKFLNEILRGKTMFFRWKFGEHNDEAEFVRAILPDHRRMVDIELSNGGKYEIRDGNGELYIVTDTEKFEVVRAADYVNECLNQPKKELHSPQK